MRDEPLQPVEPTAPEDIHLAVNMYDRDQVSEAQLGRYETVLNRLRDDHVRISEVTHVYTAHQRVIMRHEFRHGLEAYLSHSRAKRKTLQDIVGYIEEHPDHMKYGISHLRDALEGVSGNPDDQEYLEALDERRRLRSDWLEDLRGYDACLMTGPTNIMHLVGLPSVALKLGMADDGTPRGMILYGSDERRLFAAALTVERYCDPVTMPRLRVVG
jgi:hypothetical protein